MVKAFHLQESGDKYDQYRKDYNEVIDKKIEEGRNDITKEKYIILTVHFNQSGKNLSMPIAMVEKEIKGQFLTAETALQESVKSINGVGVTPIGTIERLRIMYEITHGSEKVPFHKLFQNYFKSLSDGEGNTIQILDKDAMKRTGITVKDMVAPWAIKKSSGNIQLDDDRWCKSVTYSHLPQTLDTVFLTNTTNLPYEMVTVIQLRSVPKKTATQSVKIQNTSIKADVINAQKSAYKGGYSPDLINDDLQLAQSEAQKLRDDVINKGKKLFFVTSCVTFIGKNEDEIKSIKEQHESLCSEFSFSPSPLIGQQVQGLNCAMLTGNCKLVVDYMMTSESACAMFPFNVQELQDKKGHFYGINTISKNMIMYDRKRSRLANGLIFGQSGSGKSFITKGELIPNLMDGNDDMIILDPENEYRAVASEFGGTVIDLMLNSEYHLNPCDMSMEWDDPKSSPQAEKADYMVGLVESMLGKTRECNGLEVATIHKACNRMYEPYIAEMKRRYENGDKRNIDTEICPTLKDFYEELLQDGSPSAQTIATTIEQYCVENGNYNLFSHHTNVPTGERLTIFNLLYLPEKMRETAMKVCLANIWTRIVRNREENDKYHTGKSIWVYLDEFHYFFQTERSITTIMAYFKRVRKYGGIMTGITQDVADLLRTAQGEAMFSNTGFFIFLNQSTIGRQHLQRLFNISDNLIDYIKDKPSGMGLIYNNFVLVPFNYRLPTSSQLYRIMSTNPNDENYQNSQKSLTTNI